MLVESKINAFVSLGKFLKQFQNTDFEDNKHELNDHFYDDFAQILKTTNTGKFFTYTEKKR